MLHSRVIALLMFFGATLTVATAAMDKDDNEANNTMPPIIETAMVFPTAGINNERSRKEFEQVLDSFEQLTTVPDVLIMYEDWSAHPVYAEMLLDASRNFAFPLQVVSRPREDDIHLYPAHRYYGHLKMFWWWLINHTFITTGAKQVCYFEDDIFIHPDFFTWVNHVRKQHIPRDSYWSLVGKGHIAVPLCIDLYEWSLLLRHYQHFCYAEETQWDIVLYGMHQNGPLPENRMETPTNVALNLDYVDQVDETLPHLVETYELVIPYWENNPENRETSRSADLDFEIIVNEHSAITQTQLFKIIEYCTSVALDAKSKLGVDVKLVAERLYTKFDGVDIEGQDIYHDDVKLTIPEAKHICNENLDCHGFVYDMQLNQTYFKSNTSKEFFVRNDDNPDLTLYKKLCRRTTSKGLCIPSYRYVGGTYDSYQRGGASFDNFHNSSTCRE